MANRRKHKHKYLLEVKVHRDGQSRQRVRILGGVLAIVTVVGLAGYGIYRGGVWAVNRLIFENKRYAICQIIVQNDGVFDAESVTKFAGAKIGQNLLGFDIQQAQHNLELLPLVRRAEVRRVLPDQLIIRVEERMPVAQLQVSNSFMPDAQFLIDRSGTVLKPLKLADGTVLRPQIRGVLPVLTGVSLGDIQVGRKVTSEHIYRALELLDEFEQSAAGTMAEPARVDLSHPRRLVVKTLDGSVLEFDLEDFESQLRRLGVILQWAQQRNRQVQTIDLTVARSVPVTFTN